MRQETYTKLQKKFGGQWVATSQTGAKVYASGEKVEDLFDQLKEKNIKPTKTVIGYIEEYGHINIFLSLSR